MAKADPALLRNWGDRSEMSGIVGFLAPLQLQRYPVQEKILPPKWEEGQLRWPSRPRECRQPPSQFPEGEVLVGIKDL